MTQHPSKELESLREIIEHESQTLHAIFDEMSKAIVGQHNLVEKLLIALICHGHVLVESLPGLAKTTAISSLAKTTGLPFQRLQFTPDLLPGDLIGTRIYNPQSREFAVKHGPIFTNFILADEINRAPAKVQSALLEAMQERQVTIGEETFQLPEPFLVMATQNPIEQEGTYNLPEAQIDRFMLKVVLHYPTPEEELEIMERMTSEKPVEIQSVIDQEKIVELRHLVYQVFIDDSLKAYIRDLIFCTREPEHFHLNIKNYLSYGASPRASIFLVIAAKARALLDSRPYVMPDDVKAVAPDVLRHRLGVTYEAEADNLNSADLVQQILDTVKVP